MRVQQKRQQDRQRINSAGECTCCGMDLYPGSLCWRLAGRVLCETCTIRWLLEELAPFRRCVGEVEG